MGIKRTVEIKTASAMLFRMFISTGVSRPPSNPRKVSDRLDFPFSQTFNLAQIKPLPRIKLDEADTLKDFRDETNSSVSNLHTLLPLPEHDTNNDQLDGEAKDKNL